MDRYLAEIEFRDRAVDEALTATRSLDRDAAEDLRERVASVRKRWR